MMETLILTFLATLLLILISLACFGLFSGFRIIIAELLQMKKRKVSFQIKSYIWLFGLIAWFILSFVSSSLLGEIALLVWAVLFGVFGVKRKCD